MTTAKEHIDTLLDTANRLNFNLAGLPDDDDLFDRLRELGSVMRTNAEALAALLGLPLQPESLDDVEADEEIAALRDKRNPEQVRHAAIDGVMRVISDLPADEQKKVLDYALMGVTTPSDANALAMAAYKAGGGPAEGMLEALGKRSR